MKKLILFALAVVLTFSLTACSFFNTKGPSVSTPENLDGYYADDEQQIFIADDGRVFIDGVRPTLLDYIDHSQYADGEIVEYSQRITIKTTDGRTLTFNTDRPYAYGFGPESIIFFGDIRVYYDGVIDGEDTSKAYFKTYLGIGTRTADVDSFAVVLPELVAKYKEQEVKIANPHEAIAAIINKLGLKDMKPYKLENGFYYYTNGETWVSAILPKPIIGPDCPVKLDELWYNVDVYYCSPEIFYKYMGLQSKYIPEGIGYTDKVEYYLINMVSGRISDW